jgi:hypothetical protein
MLVSDRRQANAGQENLDTFQYRAKVVFYPWHSP